MDKIVKVVKKGKLPTKVYIGTCSHCDCQVEVTQKIEYDIRNIRYLAHAREYVVDKHGVTIYCPTVGCNKIIALTGVIKK